MTTSDRFVLDTNTIISALLLRTSIPRQAFDRAFATGLVIVSDATVAELADVLQRSRFDKYVREEARLHFLATFIRDTTLVTVTQTITDCRDPKDNKFLEVAVSGHAAVIITSDRDLLDLQPYRGIAIMTPRDFLNHA
jgi:putative PIN family toxin of toxin-antitoxin system